MVMIKDVDATLSSHEVPRRRMDVTPNRRVAIANPKKNMQAIYAVMAKTASIARYKLALVGNASS